MTILGTKITCCHPENDGTKQDVEQEMIIVEDDMAYTLECPQCQRQINIYPLSYYKEKKDSTDLELDR